MQRIGRLFLLAWLCLLWQTRLGWAGSITAQVDKTIGDVSDEFEYRLTISGRFKSEPKIPDVPGLNIHRVGQSSRSFNINGSVTYEVEFLYQVTADQNGTFVIPSVVLDVDGKTERTAPIKIKVGESTPGGKDAGQDGRALFLERTLSSPEVYVGEAFTMLTKIYSVSQIVQLGGGVGNIKGFRHFFNQNKQRSVYSKNVNGVDYAVVDVVDILVPDVSGKLTIPPVTYDMRVKDSSQRRRGFDDDFFGFSMGPRLLQKRLRSENLTLTVKKLPPLPAGKIFNGLVGNFFVTGELSQHDAEVGDSITLTVTIKGEGLIDEVFDKLPLTLPPEFKVYPDKPQGDIQIDEQVGLQSLKTFKYALVPTKAGSYDLGDLVFTTFVPKIGAYADVSANLGVLNVSPGKGVNTTAAVDTAVAPKEQISKAPPSLAPEELVELKPASELTKSATLSKTLRYGLRTLFFIPIAIIMVAWARWLFSRYLRKNKDRFLTRKKARDLQERLEGLGETATPDMMLDMLREIFGTFIASKADALTQSDISEAMMVWRISPELRERVSKLYINLERLVFSELAADSRHKALLITELQAIHRGINEERGKNNV